MHIVTVFIELTNISLIQFPRVCKLDIKFQKYDLHRATPTNTRRQVIHMKFSVLIFSAKVMKLVVLHLEVVYRLYKVDMSQLHICFITRARKRAG